MRLPEILSPSEITAISAITRLKVPHRLPWCSSRSACGNRCETDMVRVRISSYRSQAMQGQGPVLIIPDADMVFQKLIPMPDAVLRSG